MNEKLIKLLEHGFTSHGNAIDCLGVSCGVSDKWARAWSLPGALLLCGEQRFKLRKEILDRLGLNFVIELYRWNENQTGQSVVQFLRTL